MTIKNAFMMLVLTLALAFSSSGCNDRFQDPGTNICGQEPCYEGPFEAPWISGHELGLSFINLMSGHPYTYDNRVLETENHLIFSDASEDWAKIRMGESAEAALTLVKQRFDLTNADIGIVDLYSKFRIFSHRGDAGPYGPWAFAGGYTIWSWDSWEFTLTDWIPDTCEHECVHSIQFILVGSQQHVWAWFREGIAEYISDGGPYMVISCWPQVDEWRQNPDHQNPITIQNLSQMPNTGAMRESYYPVFGVAVGWLVDPRGNGKTLIDVKNMFLAIRGGMGFEEAFQSHMGLSQEDYRDRFYELMESFLPANCD
jgi:hypothetical protein